MYDRYYKILDNNRPLDVIDIIKNKILINQADSTDYLTLYSMYVHTLNYSQANDLKNKFDTSIKLTDYEKYRLTTDFFDGDYHALWKTYFHGNIHYGVNSNTVCNFIRQRTKKITSLNQEDNVLVVKQSHIGDEIFFLRWIPYLKAKVNKVSYISSGILDQVLNRNFPDIIVKWVDDKVKLIDLFSLPYLLKTSNFDHRQPYINADTKKVSEIKLNNPKNKFRIGLCHHGMHTSKLRGLLKLPRDYIVEKIGGRAEIFNLYHSELTFVPGLPLGSVQESRNPDMVYLPIQGYEDVLAIMDTCDIIISCDTSIAHAAGAMGKKTYVLCNGKLHFPWFIDGNIGLSSFYQDVTVIKQQEPQCWKKAIDFLLNDVIIYK